MIPSMRFAAQSLVAFLFIPLLTQCGSKSAPATNTVTGPFDKRGNYIEDWADSPEKWYRPSAPSKKEKKPKTAVAKKEPTPAVEPRTTPRPSPVAETPKPKPKPVVVKPKPKPKPVVVRHTVRKGDTLSGLSRKYGTSIAKIKSANNISGTIIRLGQTLKIPK